MFTENEIQEMRGAAAVDAAGVKIGTVADVYLDDASGQPAWATVESGLFGTRVRFVPLGDARLDGRRLVLGFGKDVVLASPHVAEDEHLSAEEEAVLYAHYGVSAPTPPAPATATDAPVTASPESESAVPVIPVPVVPGPGPGPGATGPDDEALQEAVEATEAAHQAAQKADPLGDGSYAGDASKSSLVRTADLEAHDHVAAADAAAPVLPAASTALNRSLLQSDGVADEGADAGASLPEGVTDAEVAANDRRAEHDSEAAEASWVAAHGHQVSDPESDL
jgi:PRC-barrel domain